MSVYKTQDLYELNRTIASPLLGKYMYHWKALGDLQELILLLGPELPADTVYQAEKWVWIAKSAKIASSAHIGGPCIIDEEAEVRHCAFIRSNAIVGKKAGVGNSTELKNVVLFDGVPVPHFNYVGDSILGHKANRGAGAVHSNVKSDQSLVIIKSGEESLETGRKKVVAMVGDYVEVGCNSVLCPGCVLGKGVTVYPTSCVRGTVPENSIFKSTGNIVEKQ